MKTTSNIKAFSLSLAVSTALLSNGAVLATETPLNAIDQAVMTAKKLSAEEEGEAVESHVVTEPKAIKPELSKPASQPLEPVKQPIQKVVASTDETYPLSMPADKYMQLVRKQLDMEKKLARQALPQRNHEQILKNTRELLKQVEKLPVTEVVAIQEKKSIPSHAEKNESHTLQESAVLNDSKLGQRIVAIKKDTDVTKPLSEARNADPVKKELSMMERGKALFASITGTTDQNDKPVTQAESE